MSQTSQEEQLMSIYININQQAQGPFEESAITAWLQAGQLSPNVMACRHGANQWLPLQEVMNGATTGQAVVDWARQTFPTRVQINHKVGAFRNDFARALDADGVETAGNQKHRWQDLQYVGAREQRLTGSPLQALVKAVMYSGTDRTTFKLAFQTGEVIIPPIIDNQKEISKMLESCPAPRRKF
jgi:hypothetical protein